MNNFEYINNTVRDRLKGDKSRLVELFDDAEFFRELQGRTKDTDWYHFQPKSFDGVYLIESSLGYEVYQQDRGAKSSHRVFVKLLDAARHFFGSYW